MAVARFTVDLNGMSDSGENGATYKFFWGDDNNGSAVRPGWGKKGGCTAGYKGGGRCKCTCVMGKNMVARGDMKAMMPYRGPGDDGIYKRPASHGGWNYMWGAHNAMYATYCIGVCGADCDGPKWNQPYSLKFGRNRMYAVLVAHDVCQAYIGSKDPANAAEGVRNGCGDEVYARNWDGDNGVSSPNAQGAKAATSSMAGSNGHFGTAGLSCDAGA
jgi:hypothetical protein